jgi:ankyrin repeat protein/D-ribose pyranose/furanose isomerase RbsD
MMVEDRSMEQYPWRREDESNVLLNRVDWFDVEQMVRAMERDVASRQESDFELAEREIPGRLRLCQEWMQRYAENQATNDSSIRQYMTEWEGRLQRVSREYSNYLKLHPPPSKNEEVDLLQKIFGPRTPPPTLQSSQMDSELKNGTRIEPSVPSTVQQPDTNSPIPRKRKVAPSIPSITPLSGSTTGTAELQAAQKEQMEAAVAEMAQQMKDRTRHIHEQLQQQNQQLLQNLETTLLDNQEQLTQVTAQTQAHVRKQWYRTFSNWTMLLIMAAAFAATLLLIVVIPKQPTYRDRRYGNYRSVERNDRRSERKRGTTLARNEETEEAPDVHVVPHVETETSESSASKEHTSLHHASDTMEAADATTTTYLEEEREKERHPDATAANAEALSEAVSEIDEVTMPLLEDDGIPKSAEVAAVESAISNENADKAIRVDEESQIRDNDSNHDTSDEMDRVYRDAAAAAASGDLERLQYLLTTWPALIEIKDGNGWTLLHEAARNGHTRVVEYLLDRMISLNVGNIQARTVLGQTALDIARDKFVDDLQHPTILVLERVLAAVDNKHTTSGPNDMLLSEKNVDAATSADLPHTSEAEANPLNDDEMNTEATQKVPDDWNVDEEQADPIRQPIENDVTLDSPEKDFTDDATDEDYSDEEDNGEEDEENEDTEEVNEEFPLAYIPVVIERGDVNALTNLLESYPDLIAEVDPITGYSLLHIAAQHDRATACLQLLLEYGSDVWSLAGESELTALDVAIASFPDNNHHPSIVLLQEAMGFGNMFGSFDDDGTPPTESDSFSEECEIDGSTGECRIEAHQQPLRVEMEVPPQKSSDEILAEALREFDEMQQQAMHPQG